jgi:hypothetical protein
MKPICFGRIGQGCHLYFLAVAKAGSTKQGLVLVVPFVYFAAITLPFLLTVIWTTTVPNSLHFVFLLPLELIDLPFNPHPLPVPDPPPDP